MEFIKAKTEILLDKEERKILKTAQSILHRIFWEMKSEDLLIDDCGSDYGEDDVNLAQSILLSLAKANCSISSNEE